MRALEPSSVDVFRLLLLCFRLRLENEIKFMRLSVGMMMKSWMFGHCRCRNLDLVIDIIESSWVLFTSFTSQTEFRLILVLHLKALGIINPSSVRIQPDSINSISLLILFFIFFTVVAYRANVSRIVSRSLLFAMYRETNGPEDDVEHWQQQKSRSVDHHERLNANELFWWAQVVDTWQQQQLWRAILALSTLEELQSLPCGQRKVQQQQPEERH